MKASGRTIKDHNRLQWTAPIVLGIISEKNKIPSVNTIENSRTFDPPQTLAAYIPASVAPAVLAMVFKIKIEEMGAAIFFFIFKNWEAIPCLSSLLFATSSVPTRVEYKTASKSEQIPEIVNVKNTIKINVIMLLTLFL